MAWVRWSKICVSKEHGGLGINRNMEVFNLALLGKWKWRLLHDKESVWYYLMNRLYGNNGLLNARQFSVWWKDVKGIDEGISFAHGWFSDSVRV